MDRRAAEHREKTRAAAVRMAEKVEQARVAAQVARRAGRDRAIAKRMAAKITASAVERAVRWHEERMLERDRWQILTRLWSTTSMPRQLLFGVVAALNAD